MTQDARFVSRPDPQDFIAGEDVTEEFEIKQPVGIVLSIRLSREEAARLAQIGQQEGLNMAQTAREALLATIAAGELPARAVKQA